ncbi:PDC sensor domain-containing protein [Rhodobacteraceae bacterium NNCM2]|nr:PDC sensor domain-containing protein [Coraliihabitans acroporae]
MRNKIIAILTCMALSPVLAHAQSTPKASEYSDKVLKAARGELQEWINDPVIIYAIREQNEMNKSLSQKKIGRLDKRWVKGGSRGPMVGDLLGRQASVILRDRRELSNGLINEIIVMDALGLNAAISDATSDYYQGDEAKYQETFLVGPEAVHVSELEFDESTQKVQTQVSLPVIDPDTGELIGAVTFGISLDALTN